jgi:lysozyme family protein
MNLQKALGVKADGLIGDNTLSAFNGADDNIIRKNFINNVHSVEDQYILNDPSQKVFEQGHRNRFNQY